MMELRGLLSTWNGLLLWLGVFQLAGAITLDISSERESTVRA